MFYTENNRVTSALMHSQMHRKPLEGTQWDESIQQASDLLQRHQHVRYFLPQENCTSEAGNERPGYLSGHSCTYVQSCGGSATFVRVILFLSATFRTVWLSIPISALFRTVRTHAVLSSL